MTREEFRERYSSCFSEDYWGLEIGDGWINLLKPVMEFVLSYNQTNPEEDHIKISQIKSKFAGLRIYYDSHNEDFEKVIEEAEKKADVTCENCGKDGKLRGRGWIYIACDEHDRERKQ